MAGAKRIIRIISSLLLVGLIGCDGAGNEGGIGPCVHIYDEPIFHIQSVTDGQTGTQIETIVLSNIGIDSTKPDLRFLIIESNRIAMLDSFLVGNPPCSFGTESGLYSFLVSATGYRDTLITTDASYSVFEGGCPSKSSGGLRISITLQPM